MHNSCMKYASELKPCLCIQNSKEETFIDIYIQNQTQFPFYLSFATTKSVSGRGYLEEPGIWIKEPPECIEPGSTIFFSACSQNFSIDNEEICFFPINFIVRAEYISLNQPAQINVKSIKTRDGVGNCEDLQDFGLVEQKNNYKGNINIYENLPNDPKWSNTSFIIITDETKCKFHNKCNKTSTVS